MDTKSLFKLSYGLYFLSANMDGKDNACIVNTAIQVADDPIRISVAALKNNFTHDMILRTGKFNVSPLTVEAPFELFQRFGMQSGRNVNKFEGFDAVERSENGLYYLNKYSNAFLSAKVTETHDLGSHTLFVGELVDGEVLSNAEACTYTYYQTTIKANAQKAPAVKKGWRCKVCGYVYEGENLPDDFKCPLCHHGIEDFEYFEM